jgi:hypothetical protein
VRSRSVPSMSASSIRTCSTGRSLYRGRTERLRQQPDALPGRSAAAHARKRRSRTRAARRPLVVRFDSLDPGDRRACSCAIAVGSGGGDDGPLRTDGLARDGDRAAGGRRGGSGDDRALAGVRVERRRLARQDAGSCPARSRRVSPRRPRHTMHSSTSRSHACHGFPGLLLQ